MQKTVAAHVVNQHRAGFALPQLPARRIDSPYCRPSRNPKPRCAVCRLVHRAAPFAQIRIVRRKALEVLFSLENPRAVLELVQVQPPWAGVHVASQKGRAEVLAKDPVFVSLRHRRVPRMKCVGHRARLQHTNRSRKSTIQRAMQILGRNRRAQCEARHLGQCVNPRVGTAGALRQRRLPANPPQRGLQFALNGRQPRLHLPALEVSPVISQGDLPGPESSIGLGAIGHGIRCIQPTRCRRCACTGRLSHRP